MTRRFGNSELPQDEERAVRRAIVLAWLTIGFLLTAVTLVYLVMGSSQAMKAAWMEDMLSFIPPISFLVAVRVTRRRPTPQHPYGYHRAVGVGHLVAATALLTMGLFMVWDSATGLLAQEHPPVGLMVVGPVTLWAGWPMIAVMAYTAVPPVLLGRAKMPIARQLHDRVLYADADMNKADWMTAVGGIVGVLGIGLGLWWADSVAALFISGSILLDGVRNLGVAVRALMDAQVRTYDGDDIHPIVGRIDQRLEQLDWVRAARSRVRDQGHVFHVEAFTVPHGDVGPSLRQLRDAQEKLADLDWKVQDVVIFPVSELPSELLPDGDPTGRRRSGGHDAGSSDEPGA